jgi:hypothetical protein
MDIENVYPFIWKWDVLGMFCVCVCCSCVVDTLKESEDQVVGMSFLL